MIKNITVNIATARGHDVEMFEDAATAVDFISKTAESENKWVFIDGALVSDFSTISDDMIYEAQDITLSNQLIGG